MYIARLPSTPGRLAHADRAFQPVWAELAIIRCISGDSALIASGALPHRWQRLPWRVFGDSGTQRSWKVHRPGHSFPAQD